MAVSPRVRPWLLIVAVVVCVVIVLSMTIWHKDGSTDRKEARGATSIPQSQDKKETDSGSSESSVARGDQHSVVSEPSQSTAPSDNAVNVDIPLPSIVSEADVERLLAVHERDELVRIQDRVMRTWPRYSEMLDQLNKEFLPEIEAETLSSEELVEMALQLRNRFWESGGCFSTSAYTSAYKSRLLLELAHHKKPDDMRITDELVETIQTSWIRVNVDPVSGKIVANTANNEAVRDMLALRKEQSDQMTRAMKDKYTLRWDDFIRVNDLAWLLHATGKFEEAGMSVAWLIDNASQGGWTAYLPPLQKWRDRLKDKVSGYNYTVYVERFPGPKRFLYCGRLPSFKGYQPEKRELVPLHVMTTDPEWR